MRNWVVSIFSWREKYPNYWLFKVKYGLLFSILYVKTVIYLWYKTKLSLTLYFTNVVWLCFQKLMTELEGGILFWIVSSEIYLFIEMYNCKIYVNLNLASGKQDFPLVTVSNSVSENLSIRKTVLSYVLWLHKYLESIKIDI